MKYPNRGATALFVACMVLGASGVPAAPGNDGTLPPKSYGDHELTDAEKASLAKRRLERCRAQPGTCVQGAKSPRDPKERKTRHPAAEPPAPAPETIDR